MSLTRAQIRQRLSAPRDGSKSGDALTALRLAQVDGLIPYDPAKHGASMFTGMPTDPVGRTSTSGGAKSYVAAAVLVPLVEHADGFTILLTQRMPDLKAHAGQISFPGGRIEPEDPDPEAGALREAQEEIGLAPAEVEVLGRLDSYVTITGFDVTPIVGAIKPPMSLQKDPREVADIFEVPLAFILNRANHQRHSRVAPNGLTRGYYALPYGDRYIWGATAGMLMNLYEVLTAPL